MISSNDIRRAWVDSLISLWRRPVLDIQRGRDDDRDFIEHFFRENNYGGYWPSLLPYVREDEYHEWCGLGPAWAGRYLIGEHVFDDRSVDVCLNPKVAYFCMPGTGRMLDPAKWDQAGCPMPAEVDPHDVDIGDVLLLDTTQTGSPNHFAMAAQPTNKHGEIETVECNAEGELGDRTHGEGIIQRRHTTVPDIDGDPVHVTPRTVDDVYVALRLTKEKGHFVGRALR